MRWVVARPKGKSNYPQMKMSGVLTDSCSGTGEKGMVCHLDKREKESQLLLAMAVDYFSNPRTNKICNPSEYRGILAAGAWR